MLITGDVRAFICRDTVDMRKSIDGLSYLVQPLLGQNPLSGHLFVFVGRDRSKVKILYWDRTGFALWYKRLSHGRFPSPATLAQRGFTLAELNAWLEGIEIPAVRPHRTATATRVL
ncbi:IS66 family insertion sequence element accessory protein TnpB [Cupriavidus oxalaticus]|uniref:IS66 family insertion sequence element accessory protein TnpB n=1 Tax=Cupriavidus oxalaticus TaxID=96344 RepID=UPI003F732A7F